MKRKLKGIPYDEYHAPDKPFADIVFEFRDRFLKAREHAKRSTTVAKRIAGKTRVVHKCQKCFNGVVRRKTMRKHGGRGSRGRVCVRCNPLALTTTERLKAEAEK